MDDRWIEAQRVVVDHVLVPECQAEGALALQNNEPVLDAAGTALVDKAGGQPFTKPRCAGRPPPTARRHRSS